MSGCPTCGSCNCGTCCSATGTSSCRASCDSCCGSCRQVALFNILYRQLTKRKRLLQNTNDLRYRQKRNTDGFDLKLIFLFNY